jgi:hypothetical protein
MLLPCVTGGFPFPQRSLASPVFRRQRSGPVRRERTRDQRVMRSLALFVLRCTPGGEQAFCEVEAFLHLG